MYGVYHAVELELRAATLWVRIGGEHRNEDIAEIFRRAHLDPAVHAIVLTGIEEKHFCVGGGGAAAPDDEQERNNYWNAGMQSAREMILAMLMCDKPIVARINGHAVGRGCSLALCCDITVMVDDAKIGDTHVKVGLVAGDGGSLLWPHLVGSVQARRYLLTGDLMTGTEAARIGLITEAVPRDALDLATDNWIGKLSQGSPAAVALTKRALNASIRQEAVAHMDLSLGLETQSFLTADYREGIAALGERRAPVFRGQQHDN